MNDGTTETRRWKRGDVHPKTGLVFSKRIKHLAGGEYWVSLEKFERAKEAGWAREKERRKTSSKYHVYIHSYYQRPEVKERYARIRSSEKRRAYVREWAKRRYHSDPNTLLKARIRSRVRNALKSKGFPKKGPTADMIGCDWPSLKTYIETRFKPGMTWENYSEWHIDHVIPLSSAKSAKEMLRLSHYSNLLPIWRSDNLSKSGRTPRQTEFKLS